MKKKILITGGTGLVGSRLTTLLLERDYKIAYLSRSEKDVAGVEVFKWDIDEGFIDEKAFEQVEAIVHLAGAGVADKSWTESRKQEILESRTKSSDLLYEYLKKLAHRPKTFVSASAVGIYGSDSENRLFHENDSYGNDFLAEVTKAWEAEVEKMATLNIRTVKLRIGVVLSEKGGALEKIAQPIRYGVGAPLGSGKQYMSWVHIDDLCRMFIRSIEDDNLSGAYNATAPNPRTNADLTKAVAKVLKKPLFLPNVPSFALKLALGEMATVVLNGNKVSSQKIEDAGFEFKFAELEPALEDLLL